MMRRASARGWRGGAGRPRLCSLAHGAYHGAARADHLADRLARDVDLQHRVRLAVRFRQQRLQHLLAAVSLAKPQALRAGLGIQHTAL
eukprot:5465104-Prymnesium_polylepis.1